MPDPPSTPTTVCDLGSALGTVDPQVVRLQVERQEWFRKPLLYPLSYEGSWTGGGLIGLLVLIAAIVLAVTGRYPHGRTTSSWA